MGDGDVLHVIWYDGASNAIRHKQLQADLWTDVSTFGWNPLLDVGADVGTFNDANPDAGAITSAAGWVAGDIHLFPTIVVDRARTPDRAYVLWKHHGGAGTGDHA